MARASRHADERDVSGGAVFLFPFAQASGHAPDHPAPVRDGGEAEGRIAAYDAFIDKIIAAARAMPPEPAPGTGDIRLKGLRQ